MPTLAEQIAPPEKRKTVIADLARFVDDEVGRKGGRQDINAAYFPAIPAGAKVSAINQLADQVDCFYFDGAGALRVNWVVNAGACR